MSTNENKNENLIDLPILYPGDDILGFEDIAKRLVETINRKEYVSTIKGCYSSFTIGVLGKWGSGKSSLVNLIKNRLSENSDYEICNFNPWYFESQRELLISFFNTIKRTLSKFNFLDKELEKYFNEFVEVMVDCIDSGIIKDRFVFKALRVFSRHKKRKFNDIDYLKKSIQKKMKDFDKTIVFFIDDLDRCLPDEILYTLKLIRLIADFPNICYVVSFDYDHIAKILDNNGMDGMNYIQKFIQLQVVIPPLSEDIVYYQLLQDFRKNQIECTNDLAQVIAGCIPDLRSYKKYINRVLLDYQTFKEYLNPDDFLLCTVLKTVVPVFFEKLLDYPILWSDKYKLAPNHEKFSYDIFKKEEEENNTEKKIDQFKIKLNEIKSYYNEQRCSCPYEKIFELLCNLFPKIYSFVHWGHISEPDFNLESGFDVSFSDYAFRSIYYQLSVFDISILLNTRLIDSYITAQDSSKQQAWITKIDDHGYTNLLCDIMLA